MSGKNGLLNAPTGSGKTYALWLPLVASAMASGNQKEKGIRVLWITPLRALARDLQKGMQRACDELDMGWDVGVRNGDMSNKERTAQKKQMPQGLVITPESLHLLFTLKNHADLFKNLQAVIVDEWHELLGNKRGVQTELAISHLHHICKPFLLWGVSATIGNLPQAMEVLFGNNFTKEDAVIIRASTKKKLIVRSILPDDVSQLPWAGHLGINLMEKVVPVIKESKGTLLFTNTRSQTEIWYRVLMEKHPELAGLVALHHGSLDRELRNWVEENLHAGKLKLVICTSSLDLGVDFRPVETVIQVGSPKSISRFIQRAGRSGHRPDATSLIYFVPTHSLELIEAASLKQAISENMLEPRTPIVNAFDVLAQWMITLATGAGFREQELFIQMKNTHAYKYIDRYQWEWLLGFITTGGPTLTAYDEFRKVAVEDGIFIVKSKRVAMQHRLSMGTIISDSMLRVKFQHGKYLGSMEEFFLSRLKPGDVFGFAGMNLEFIRIREMTVTVKKSTSKKGIVPAWMGGRMPLSSQLSAFIRKQLDEIQNNKATAPEIKKLLPLIELQQYRSAIPTRDQLLIETCTTREGCHIFIFPFEGRLVHEGMAALIAYRIGRIHPITFSIAMNDYGFELLSDQPVHIRKIIDEHDLFTTDNLLADIERSVNAVEMSKRKFREIASIAGLVFQGYPGKGIKTRHLQSSSSLLFDVMQEHDRDNLLVKQAYQEVLDQQLEEQRMRTALRRIGNQHIIINSTEKPTPFSFPILVDGMRDQLSSEKMEDRIKKLVLQYS